MKPRPPIIIRMLWALCNGTVKEKVCLASFPLPSTDRCQRLLNIHGRHSKPAVTFRTRPNAPQVHRHCYRVMILGEGQSFSCVALILEKGTTSQ
jgi:hypothetical protein